MCNTWPNIHFTCWIENLVSFVSEFIPALLTVRMKRSCTFISVYYGCVEININRQLDLYTAEFCIFNHNANVGKSGRIRGLKNRYNLQVEGHIIQILMVTLTNRIIVICRRINRTSNTPTKLKKILIIVFFNLLYYA